ncbi:hydroxyacylglutathione hydrolase [Agarivorans gilvus]|uniref:Hydroxyacylglutathione hydrolase n=1 Tax=Agarivorans gilvus TaxID=680279 RepID=A0ABQ1I4E9_9ALTE|nr:hydroxyacylglutathione hydrolase [Agarivorans gilvus]GGB09154.1 hydroxyacylglutathione hydrolase [Agarivorans gilvus]
MQILHIPAFNDNYIWLIKEPDSSACVVVDPGDAEVVKQRLNDMDCRLSAILITHHHADHIGGVTALLSSYPQAKVYGPKHGSYPFPHQGVAEGEQITPEGLSHQFELIDVPGHTLDHVAYLSGQQLFIGDTLFAAGCGRLFEGSAEQMHHSLSKLKALEPSTQIYSAHEYTQANVQFALAVEPENQALLAYQKQVSKLRQSGLPTLPSSLEQQLAVNPFLRCDKASVKAAVEIHSSQPLNNEIAVFAGLRSWKDSF